MRTDDAVTSLLQALDALGIAARRGPMGDPGITVEIDGRKAAWAVRSTSLVSLRDVPGLAASQPSIIVAGRVVTDARDALRRQRCSWLDLRGHLYLTGSGVLVDADVPAQRARAGRTAPFAGQAGLDVACALLLEPATEVVVRALARRVGRAPSTTSEVLAALDSAGLLTRVGRPLLPDLFWAVAEAWRPRAVPFGAYPPSEGPIADVLGVHARDVTAPGWAVGDTVAAAAYGAPIAAPADYPPDIHVPSASALRQAQSLLIADPAPNAVAVTLRVAPTRLVCTRRIPHAPWPLAHPLFVALDLSIDPDRGRQVVEQWTPPAWATRVW